MPAKSIKLLDLHDKETIVAMLMDVQVGQISCRRAADEIMKQLTKPHLSEAQRKRVRKMQKDGYKTSKIASVFKINPATVWRICNR